VFLAGGAVSAADWVLSPFIAAVFHMPNQYRPETVFLLRTFGVLVTISLIHGLFVSLLQARQRFSWTSRATIASYLAWAAGLYLTVRAHQGLRGVALSLIAEQVLATIIILPAALRYLTARATGFLPRSDVRQFFGYASKVQVMGLAAMANSQLDALVIGAILPVRNVGLYNAGANVSTQLRYVATSVLPPASTRLANTFGRSGQPDTQLEMARLQRLWVIATSGWCSAGIGAAYFGVVAWLGPQFRISALVCMILLAGHAVNLLTGVMTVYVGAIGRPGIETRYGVFAVVVNLALTVPLAFVGVLGVVAATAVGSVVSSVYLVRVVHKQLSPDVPSFLSDVPILRCLACLAVTVGLELAVAPVAPLGPLGLIVCAVPAVVGLAVYSVSFLGIRQSVRVVRSVLGGRSPFELSLAES
jgi:O-antigen/teichoic acid export membrane protein